MRKKLLTTIGAIGAGVLLVLTLASPAAAQDDQPNGAAPTTQTDANGDTFTLSADGSWTIKFSAEPATEKHPRWDVSYCSGRFAPYQVVNRHVLWGGEQTCDDYRHWPHRIQINLESTCDGPLCIVFTHKGSIDSGLQMSRVVRANGDRSCPSSNVRRYRMIVHAYANGGGVQFGPFFGSESRLACGG